MVCHLCYILQAHTHTRLLLREKMSNSFYCSFCKQCDYLTEAEQCDTCGKNFCRDCSTKKRKAPKKQCDVHPWTRHVFCSWPCWAKYDICYIDECEKVLYSHMKNDDDYWHCPCYGSYLQPIGMLSVIHHHPSTTVTCHPEIKGMAYMFLKPYLQMMFDVWLY